MIHVAVRFTRMNQNLDLKTCARRLAVAHFLTFPPLALFDGGLGCIKLKFHKFGNVGEQVLQR